jgi:small-conductance mechanosensitive channel
VPLSELIQQNPWTATAVVALFSVLGSLIARAVIRAVLVRATRDTTVLSAMLRATNRAGSAALPLLVLQLVWLAAPGDLQFIGTVRHLNALLLIGALTWFTAAMIAGVANGVIARNPVTVADNLQARRIHTQTHVLSRTAMVVVVLAGTSMALMTFPGARQVGASLLASAGVIGIVAGIAARPVLGNLIAGLQLALAQPIRMDDVLIIKGEWGRVEEITGSYVVLKVWDERRLIIPLQWFIENPFENWTRSNSQIMGTVFLYLDFATPIESLRAEVRRVVEAAPEWDRRVCVVQVTDATERTMQVRILVSAASSGDAFDLRCRVREQLLAFLAREYPDSLPRLRVDGEEVSQPGFETVAKLRSPDVPRGTRPAPSRSG